jgi:polysaccharide biosynthesis transport protein
MVHEGQIRADHFAVVNLRNRMREIRNSYFEELKRFGETFKSDYEIAKSVSKNSRRN